MYGALAYFLAAALRARWAKALVLLSGLVLVLAIGFSRVYLGVHYPSDVLAGYSAGLAWLMICALLVRDRAQRSGTDEDGASTGATSAPALGSSSHTSAPS